jgi:hypothetical protein
VKLALALAALVTMTATAAAQAQPSWKHIPYPPHPEGSILTLPGPFRMQFIIMVNELNDPGAEIHQLFTLAAVRTTLLAKFHLRTRAGHTPRKGYRLACLSRIRVRGDTIWFAAWAAPNDPGHSADYSAAIKWYSLMIDRSKWRGGCATR